MANETHVIGVAKRDIKAGERIKFRIRPDGFAESYDLRFRNGMAFVDLTVVAGKKEEAGQTCPANNTNQRPMKPQKEA
jgi:hypothetical protein